MLRSFCFFLLAIGKTTFGALPPPPEKKENKTIIYIYIYKMIYYLTTRFHYRICIKVLQNSCCSLKIWNSCRTSVFIYSIVLLSVFLLYCLQKCLHCYVTSECFFHSIFIKTSDSFFLKSIKHFIICIQFNSSITTVQ